MRAKKQKNSRSSNYATKAHVNSAVDNLAILVNRGFDRVEKNFVKTNELIVKIDEKFTKRFDDLQYQINRIETHILKDHQHRLEIIEQKLGIER